VRMSSIFYVGRFLMKRRQLARSLELFDRRLYITEPFNLFEKNGTSIQLLGLNLTHPTHPILLSERAASWALQIHWTRVVTPSARRPDVQISPG
jgi:hypothetical protein